MAEKKSIIEEALLDVKKIQNALNANTKEILRSVAREEIDGLVKESLMEDDYEEETIGDEDSVEGDTETPEAPAGEEEVGGGEEAGSEELGGETGDSEIQTSDEVDPEGQEFGMDAGALGGDELDMTGESDDDVIAIYKKLSGEDEIEIVGDEIHMTINEPGEYIVKTNDVAGAEAPIGGEELGPELGGDEFGGEGDDDEVSYEIAMDDEEPESEETPETPETEAPAGEEEVGGGEEEKPEEDDEQIAEGTESEEDEDIVKETSDEEEEEDVVKEQIPVGIGQAHRLPGKADIGQPKGAGAAYVKESTTSKKQIVTEAEVKYKKLLTEATKLKSENDQFREALKKFRNMLVETVVFNSNLSYITKLFMEHSITKNEKERIIKRFDEDVRNLKDSKKLYKTIVEDLTSRKPINETVENKIIKDVTTSSSKQLNEATAYVDPSVQRIRDLINRVEDKNKY